MFCCDREPLQVQDDISQVVHPEAVSGWAMTLPRVLGGFLHSPVCVSLQDTYENGLSSNNTSIGTNK